MLMFRDGKSKTRNEKLQHKKKPGHARQTPCQGIKKKNNKPKPKTTLPKAEIISFCTATVTNTESYTKGTQHLKKEHNIFCSGKTREYRMM